MSDPDGWIHVDGTRGAASKFEYFVVLNKVDDNEESKTLKLKQWGKMFIHRVCGMRGRVVEGGQCGQRLTTGIQTTSSGRNGTKCKG